ncbi:MAG: hypothetical protein KatS3mg103_0510 [Phycisphaerales bacterium]|nr:MAG: hypothetical protein KatS3mg103_0510 [Phycisphaerales bacterium]
MRPAGVWRASSRSCGRLDRSELAGDVVVRTYRPVRAEPQAVASAIRELAGSGALGGSPRTPLHVSVEPATRTLIVSGPADAFAQVERLLGELDGAPAVAESTVKLYRLRHARAERLEPLLRDLLTTRLREQQRVGGLGVSDVASLLTVSAEPATNTLIISAPPVAHELAERLVEALDSDEAGAGAPVVRVVPLSYGRADQIAPQLERALAELVLPSGGKVGVSAVGGANALLLTGTSGDLEVVGKLVSELDVRPFDPDAVGVETFELRHADAGQIAPVVERLLAQQRESNLAILREILRRDPSAAQVTPVRVEADEASNTLLVSGPSELVALARQLVDRLDRPSGEGERTLRTFTPARADAQRLAQAVREVAERTIERDRLGLEITAEPMTGTVLVVGGEAAVERAVSLLERFDAQSPVAPMADVAVVPLRRASASVVAQTLEPLLGDRARWPAELVRAERAGLSVPRPTVRADAQGNRLVLSVPSAMMPMALGLIESLDGAAEVQAGVDVRLVRLSRGDAQSVAQAVQDALRASRRADQPEPTVRAEAGSNSIIIAASASQIEQAEALIAQMDVQVEPEAAGVLTLVLEHTRAETLAPILEAILQQESVVDLLPWWAVGDFAARNPDQAVRPAVRVIAEPQRNAVVVSAPRPMLDLAREVAAELDVPGREGGAGGRVVRLVALRNADAAQVAQNLTDVLTTTQGGVTPPTIRVDAGSNTLIVRATPAQMAEIEDLARRIDQATLVGSRQLRLVPIDRSRADAASVAQALRQLLEQQGQVKVQVIGVEELLERDAPIGPGGALPMRRDSLAEAMAGALLAGVQAAEAAQRSDGQAGQGEPDEQGDADGTDDEPDGPGPGPGSGPGSGSGSGVGDGAAGQDRAADGAQASSGEVTIAVDRATNTLVVVGSPRMTDRLASLAEQIQRQMPAQPTRVRVVRLPGSANAQALAQVVRQTVQRVGAGQRPEPRRVHRPAGRGGRSAGVVADRVGQRRGLRGDRRAGRGVVQA